MQLTRILGQRQVIALAFGAMIGWSWVLLTATWIERAGTVGAMLAFLGAGVAMVLIALTYAELAAAMPQLGGEHVYTSRAFGPGAAFVCTWALLLGYVSVVAFEVVALPVALAYLFPALNLVPLWKVAGWDVYAGHVAIGIGAAVALTLVNVRGITSAAGLQGAGTLLIVLAGLVLLSGAPGSGSAGNFSPAFAAGGAGVLGVVVMVPLMFVGFDVIPQAAEEIDLPPRRIGRLVVVSVFCAVAWYVVMIGLVGWLLSAEARHASELATAAAATQAWGGAWAGKLIVAGGIAGIVTTWNAFLVGASRVVYVLAASGQLPAWLSADAPGQVGPARALWLICFLSCLAPWFGRPILVWLIDAGSVGVIVAYAFVAASFLRLRRRAADLARPYLVAHGELVGLAALTLAILIGALYLPWSPSALVWPQEWLILALWSACGALLYTGTRRGRLTHSH